MKLRWLAARPFGGYDRDMNDAAFSALYAEHIEVMKARHDRALERAGASHAVLFSGAAKPVFLDDYHYPFKPNPHFVSWLPVTASPGCYLVYTPGETPVLVYYLPKDYWHSAPADPDGFWAEHFDVRVIHDACDAAAHLPVEREKCILIGDIDDPAQACGIERVNPVTAVNMLHYARAAKTGYELECMRHASVRGARAHAAAEAAFRGGNSEFAIHLHYCAAAGQREQDLPYGNIVALNEHGAVLHHTELDTARPDEIRSFLIDAGASVNGYACDITRTYSSADDEFAELIARFEVLQLALVERVRAGLSFVDLHLDCHRMIGELLVEIGLASGSAESLMEAGVTSAFYPHGLGHLLGIQVHDVGGHMSDETGNTADPPSGHPFLRLTRTLEVDQVLTIEPGIYAIDMLIENLEGSPGRTMINDDRLAWLRPYGGIRIEDNVRVLEDGCENLTRQAFSSIAA